MKRQLVGLLLLAACGSERTTSVNGNTGLQPAAETMQPSIIGTWHDDTVTATFDEQNFQITVSASGAPGIRFSGTYVWHSQTNIFSETLTNLTLLSSPPQDGQAAGDALCFQTTHVCAPVSQVLSARLNGATLTLDIGALAGLATSLATLTR